MYLGKISRLIDVFGFGSVYSNCFLQKQATLVLLLLDFFFLFFSIFQEQFGQLLLCFKNVKDSRDCQLSSLYVSWR